MTKATVSLYSVGTSASVDGSCSQSGKKALSGRSTNVQLKTASVSAKPMRKPPMIQNNHMPGEANAQQRFFTVGTGGVTGAGLGMGRPQDIPFSATDAIFAVIGEELGLLGATAMLLGFLLIVVRGFKIAQTAKDEFSTLLAVGLTVTLAFQTFVIVGGLTRLVPLTGITLPFVSYGGSSLLSNYLLIGLLLRISDESRAQAIGRQEPRRKAAPARETAS
jgi:hypothetical protein